MSSRKHIVGCVCPYCKPEVKAKSKKKPVRQPFGKLDLKYSGLIMKCSEIVPNDEWVVFRAKDDALLDTLDFYMGKCQALGVAADDPHIQSILALKGRVRTWRGANPHLCKVPDTKLDELLFDALEGKWEEDK